jgi:hypothetical protein
MKTSVTEISRLGRDMQDQTLLAEALRALDVRYDLGMKIENEPGGIVIHSDAAELLG